MTPTLAGRWQSRLLLFVFIGLPVTFLYAWVEARGDLTNLPANPFLFLLVLLGVGLVLDPLYYWVQTYRWERDWPFAFQWVAMWAEFWIVVLLVLLGLAPFLDAREVLPNETAFWGVVLHFTLILIPSFLALLGGLQVFMVRWRFKGGEWGRL